MITEQALQEAIAECQGVRNPTANTCVKLASYYTIRNEMYGRQHDDGYSFAPDQSRVTADSVVYGGKSEFAAAVDGKDQAVVWPVIDELVGIIRMLHPKLYTALIDKLS